MNKFAEDVLNRATQKLKDIGYTNEIAGDTLDLSEGQAFSANDYPSYTSDLKNVQEGLPASNGPYSLPIEGDPELLKYRMKDVENRIREVSKDIADPKRYSTAKNKTLDDRRFAEETILKFKELAALKSKHDALYREQMRYNYYNKRH